MSRWHNCPSLAAFWCSGISASIHLYAIYSGFSRFSTFKVNSLNPRYGYDWNENYIACYLYFILAACLFLMLLLYSSIVKTGNLANDYIDLARIFPILEDSNESRNIRNICTRTIRRFKYHLLPFNTIMHLFGSFCLLAPIPLIIEEEERHEISNSRDNTLKFQPLTLFIPEIANFILAATMLIVRAPTVFVNTSQLFSIVYSLTVFIGNLSVLIHVITSLLVIPRNLAYEGIRYVLIHTAIFVITVLNYCLIYEHGRSRYIDSLLNKNLNLQDQPDTKSAILNKTRPLFERYWPNVISLIILLFYIVLHIYFFLLTAALNSLYIIDIISAIFNCLTWLVIWLLFTFRSDWEFTLPNDMALLTSRNNSYQLHQGISKPTDTIYTCFHAGDVARALSSQSSRTPNPDIASNASSSSSHTSSSGRPSSQRLIPTLSRQVELTDVAYEDINSVNKQHGRTSRNALKEITEENQDYQEMYTCRPDTEFFKSPNVSQRSSNIHSSDSGIGVTFRENGEYVRTLKTPDNEYTNKYRQFPISSGHLPPPHEFDVDDECLRPGDEMFSKMCSDV